MAERKCTTGMAATLILRWRGYGHRGQKAMGEHAPACSGADDAVLPAALESVAVAVHLQDMDVVVRRSSAPVRRSDPKTSVHSSKGRYQDGPLVAQLKTSKRSSVVDRGTKVDDQQPEAVPVRWP